MSNNEHQQSRLAKQPEAKRRAWPLRLVGVVAREPLTCIEATALGIVSREAIETERSEAQWQAQPAGPEPGPEGETPACLLIACFVNSCSYVIHSYYQYRSIKCRLDMPASAPKNKTRPFNLKP